MYDMTLNTSGTSKDSGPKLPSTVAEWALFEVPQEVHTYYIIVINYYTIDKPTNHTVN